MQDLRSAHAQCKPARPVKIDTTDPLPYTRSPGDGHTVQQTTRHAAADDDIASGRETGPERGTPVLRMVNQIVDVAGFDEFQDTADALFAFHREVEQARERLAAP